MGQSSIGNLLFWKIQSLLFGKYCHHYLGNMIVIQNSKVSSVRNPKLWIFGNWIGIQKLKLRILEIGLGF